MSANSKAADVSAALADCIEQLATYLIGAPPSSRSRDELRYRSRGSLAVITSGRKRGIWCDHESGAGGDPLDLIRQIRGGSIADALAWAIGWLGLPEGERPAPAARPESDDRSPEPGKNIEIARTLFRESVAAAGTLAESYLHARGCCLPPGGVIRFHPACPRGRGERLPAMMALMTDALCNTFAVVHRTFLRPDGLAKIEHGTAKMMLGGAGVIRLVADADITLGLGICEGVETGLTLIQRAGWAAVWAVGSAGAIAKFPVLNGIECLTLFPDTDDKGAGRNAALACAERWHDAGREVQTIWPPGGSDWNDRLTREAA